VEDSDIESIENEDEETTIPHIPALRKPRQNKGIDLDMWGEDDSIKSDDIKGVEKTPPKKEIPELEKTRETKIEITKNQLRKDFLALQQTNKNIAHQITTLYHNDPPKKIKEMINFIKTNLFAIDKHINNDDLLRAYNLIITISHETTNLQKQIDNLPTQLAVNE